jgi:hypothetical protein
MVCKKQVREHRVTQAGTLPAPAEMIMANDADWVADVRRWYFAREQAKVEAAPVTDHDSEPMGYEAAQPILQSRHWPDAPRTNFTDLI